MKRYCVSNTVMATLIISIENDGRAHIALNGVIPSGRVMDVVDELDGLIDRLLDPADGFDEVVGTHYLLEPAMPAKDFLLGGVNR